MRRQNLCISIIPHQTSITILSKESPTKPQLNILSRPNDMVPESAQNVGLQNTGNSWSKHLATRSLELITGLSKLGKEKY